MPKRLYIPEWDGIYPPKKKSDSANKVKYAEKTHTVNKNKGKKELIRERGKLEQKCDTFQKCKKEESCNSCEIFKRIKEIDAKIEDMEKKFIIKEGEERSQYYETRITKEEGIKPYFYKKTKDYMKFQKFKICKYCGKRYFNEHFVKKHIDQDHYLLIDLHGLYLKDAIHFVKLKIDECIDCDIDGLKLIHGYHHGTRLRDYFRSDLFREEMTNEGKIIGTSSIRDLGYTLIKVNKQKYKKK